MNDNRKTIPIIVRVPQEDAERLDKRLLPNQSRQDAIRVMIKDFGREKFDISEPAVIPPKNQEAA
jgi:hypothetical protein